MADHGAGKQGERRRMPGGASEHDPTVWHARLVEALSSHEDGQEALAATCEVVRELVPCDRVQVWRGDLRQMSMSTMIATGYPPGDAMTLASLVAPMPTRTIMHKDFLVSKAAFVPDVRTLEDPFGNVVFGPFGIEAAFLLLLERGARVIGALQLSWCDRSAALRPGPEIEDTIRRYVGLAVDFLARTDDAVRLSETLSETAVLLASIQDPDELLQTTAARIAEAVGCDWAAVHLIEGDEVTFFRAAEWGIRQAFTSRFQVPADGLAAAVSNMQDGVFEVPDTSALAEPTPMNLDRTQIASYFSVPLLAEDRLAGFLSLGYRTRTGRFSRRQISLAKGLVHHAQAALRNARTMRSLREVNQVKSDFLAAVSHDLRTPLHVLIGYSDMLVDGTAGPLNGLQADLVGRLREGAVRFRDLIDDVLDVARLDAGQDVLVVAPVALADLCEELRREVEVLRPRAVELRIEVGDLTVLGDGAKIKTILRNLLSNALKFTREGEVRIAADRATGDEVRLVVRDTGPGIAPEDRSRIFEMFQQGDIGRRSGGSGLGLGLYLVKRVTELLGGRVELVSGDPGDTRFEVHLPLRSAPRSPGAPR
jgi:signal transduction histidine kinase